MKRHSGGEKKGSDHGLSFKNNLIVAVFILSQQAYPQIPINGFCFNYSSQIPRGYERLFAADLNTDNKDEFILYSYSLKKLGIITAKENGIFNLNEYPVAEEISQIVKYKSTNQNLFVFASRKNSTVSLFNVKINYPPELISKISFDSYPEKLQTGDLNKDGNTEILVCGSGFDGISVLSRDGLNLTEKKIMGGSSFSHAILPDLDNDGMPDIAAFNLLENSLHFLYNNGKGRFTNIRSYKLDSKIVLLRTLDIDKDGFDDIIYSTGTTISIMFGDFQSAYNNKINLSLETWSDEIQFGDFNNDGLTDIAYLNSDEGLIKIIYAKSHRKYYDEISYLRSTSTSSIASFKNNNKYNLAYLGKDGIVGTINRYESLPVNFNFVPAVNPGALKMFNMDNDNVHDFLFDDESDNSLKILWRDEKGIPSLYYSVQLASNHNEIIVDDFFHRRKTFYCYTKNSPLLEAIRYNFRTNKFNHQKLYSPGNIFDISVIRADSSLVYVYLVYEKSGKMYLGRFEHRELSITFKEYPFIDRDVISAELFIEQNPVVYYWKENEDSLFFNRVEIKTGPNNFQGITGIAKSDSNKIYLYARDNKDYPEGILSLFQSDNTKSLIISDGLKINIYKSNSNEYLPGNFNFTKAYFGGSGKKGFNEWSLYSLFNKAFMSLIINRDNHNYDLRILLEAEGVSDYFIDKFDFKNFQLVYSNKQLGCISIVSLK